MRPELSLCGHLAALAPGPAPFTIEPADILEFDGEVVVAIVRCTECGACGWLSLHGRDAARGVRTYALAAIRAEDVALYHRDLARGSCDAGRARAELDALVASTGPRERLVALDRDMSRVVASEAAARR